jgi:hypothetical protein
MTTITPSADHRLYFLYTPTVLFGSFYAQVQSDPNYHYGILEKNAQLTTTKTQYLAFDNFIDWQVWADYADLPVLEQTRMQDLFNSLP